MTLTWPQGIYPKEQIFRLKTLTTQFISQYTAHVHVEERAGVRWVAEFTFELENARARKMDAFIAQLRGAVGAVYVPDFRRQMLKPVLDSMDAYAEEIGLTFFEDRYDFDDQTHEDGLLTIEESPPLGGEANALFGGIFDALLLFEDDVTLLTEAGLDIWAENVGIPFETNRGYILTIEHGEALEIAVEEGYTLQTQVSEDIPLQVGGGFIEGEGQSTLITGSNRELLIGGLAPWRTVIKMGESIMPAEGHAHLILEDVTTDINGNAVVPIAPYLRTIVAEQPLVLGGLKVLMRLTSDDAGENNTVPPNRSSYTLTFEQILN